MTPTYPTELGRQDLQPVSMDGAAGPPSNGGQPPSRLKINTGTGALASIAYNSTADHAPSSDDEPNTPMAVYTDNCQTAMCVSISREQTRLMSPATPALEKAAALEKAGGFSFDGFGGSDDALVQEMEEDDGGEEEAQAPEANGQAVPLQPEPTASSSEQVSASSTLDRPTSTSQSELSTGRSKEQLHARQKPKSGIFEGIFTNRQAESGDTTSEATSSHRSILSNLTHLPKHFSFSSRHGFETDSNYQTSNSSLQLASSKSSSQDTHVDTSIPPDVANNTPKSPVASALSPTSPLRRSTSDSSLATHRALTRVESLGDDSRFEDVHDQVNSRFKAIKDSWQDANFKLPGVPAVKVSSLTADSIRARVGSLTPKQNTRSLSHTPSERTSSSHSKPTDPMTRHPYADVKAAMTDAASDSMHPHPHFHRALEQLEGDIVILGGYRGSILRSAKPPHRQVWVPIKVGLNLRRVNLEVGFNEDDDERATERIIPDGMLTHIGPVDISRRLLKRLRLCDNAQAGKLRVHEYGYDWRLTPTHLSQQLVKYLEGLPCNRKGTTQGKRGATVIAHSLGGLITRHAVNQRPDLFAGVLYAGVPQTCVNILGPLRNGDEVLISNRVLTAQVNFSIRTSFALLPLDGRCFFDKDTKEQYPVDFFDVNTWDELRLSPCINRPLPPLQPPPKPTGLQGYVNTVANMLPSLPHHGRKESSENAKVTTAGGAAAANPASSHAVSSKDQDKDLSVRTAVTVPRDEAIAYLRRTLASVKKFKEELAFRNDHATSNVYPPVAVIYGKSTPTVYGARVDGRAGIKHADAYDDLAFASGDGVVLARAAMVPEGYKACGIVASDRGHVTLLGDLDAVGKCLNAVIRARRKGFGTGKS